MNEDDFKGLARLAEFVGEKLETGVVLYSGTRVLPFLINGQRLFAVPISLLLTAAPPQRITAVHP